MTRQIILDVAADLVTKGGYDSTSVADICEAAGVSKGAFYHHFESKQVLFMALMQQWMDTLDEGFDFAAQQTANVPECLINMAASSGHVISATTSGFPILIEFWRQANLDPLIWKEAVTPYRRYLTYFEKLVQKGKTEGSFTEATNPKVAARLLLSFAMGFLLQASFDPEGTSWEEDILQGMQLLLCGLRR